MNRHNGFLWLLIIQTLSLVSGQTEETTTQLLALDNTTTEETITTIAEITTHRHTEAISSSVSAITSTLAPDAATTSSLSNTTKASNQTTNAMENYSPKSSFPKRSMIKKKMQRSGAPCGSMNELLYLLQFVTCVKLVDACKRLV